MTTLDIYIQDSGEDNDDAMVVVPVVLEPNKKDNLSNGLNSVDDKLSILPLRNMVLFPEVVIPITVNRQRSNKLLRDATKKRAQIAIFCQKKQSADEPALTDLYTVGTIAEILRVFEMPDGGSTVLVQGKKRCTIKKILKTEPYLTGIVEHINDIIPKKSDREFEAIASNIKDLTVKIMSSSFNPPSELIQSIRNNRNKPYLINFAASNLVADTVAKQELLAINDFKERANKLLVLLNKENQLLELKTAIQMKTNEAVNKEQKEYFLHQQIKAIQKELGNENINDIEIAELRKKAKKKLWSKEVAEIFEKEIVKLERINPHSPDYSMQTEYVQTILNLPWNKYTKDSLNLTRAERVLNHDHYGMDKVKERILEHLAVLILKKDMRSPIICLYGPPGIGKTSLGKSIAQALNRKYVRVSLGGLHDEAEIRGHRRTYIGAMAGRIIDGIEKANSSNPVFVLDEIDKVGNDFKGDPAAALLEVLDPEQNERFHDNYLDIDFDLSKVMFIATANNLNSISQPLLDRMEIIEMSGYITDEKIHIANKHLIPKQLDAHGIKSLKPRFDKDALKLVIENYTRESGVRELEKKIAKIFRKTARKIACGQPVKPVITVELVREYLGIPEYNPEKYQGNDYAGVVTGLAWTAAGGEILFVETSLSKFKGSKMTITGNLGDVMKESAVIALEYVHAHSKMLGIEEDMFEDRNVHIHVPEGAIPKDGPSAGITMVTSVVSAFTQRKVRENLAMTGEITLRGKVMPVGGIREKILAAKRAGITDIILCDENRKDIEEIKPEYLKGLSFHYVSDISEVLDYALL
ncbi:MAG: endopeptidase La [Tannerella sp.]|jgi:ATP-dependent Lon protease|nr:endopeptidase La [Tannerella sp.]